MAFFENNIQLEEETFTRIIKVIGVGGGGSNAVRHMYEHGIADVDFVICNTDLQALNDNPVQNKIQLGPKLTEGLGAGTEPEQGRLAAVESAEQIREMLADHTKMVFITAGMGGGTGTGAAPEIARIAKELDILTVAIVTAPYSWEGSDKINAANEGIELLQKTCDTVLIVLNDKLLEIYQDSSILEAFSHADDVLTNATKSVAEVITKSGKINADFMDVRKVLNNAGQAVMSTAQAKGKNRAEEVIKAALHSPLLNNRDIKGAKRILITIATSSENVMIVKEQQTITDYIQEAVGGRTAGTKLGYIVDETLGEDLRITLIAAGFNLQDGPVKSIAETEETEDLMYSEQQKSVSSVTIQQLIAKFTERTPSETELEAPAFARNHVKLIDINKIPAFSIVERHLFD
ncbi:MAG: cell division protein FtsZ [Pseudarcicella sp.]|nr:cell division protein FtsZ [Pseudarcicella sp.]MBP6410102.1 cell division protein FtsZ [Pseudarcicella sp.]